MFQNPAVVDDGQIFTRLLTCFRILQLSRMVKYSPDMFQDPAVVEQARPGGPEDGVVGLQQDGLS